MTPTLGTCGLDLSSRAAACDRSVPMWDLIGAVATLALFGYLILKTFGIA
jgi:hypothetical protein